MLIIWSRDSSRLHIGPDRTLSVAGVAVPADLCAGVAQLFDVAGQIGSSP